MTHQKCQTRVARSSHQKLSACAGPSEKTSSTASDRALPPPRLTRKCHSIPLHRNPYVLFLLPETVDAGLNFVHSFRQKSDLRNLFGQQMVHHSTGQFERRDASGPTLR